MRQRSGISISEKYNKVFAPFYDGGTVVVVDGATDTLVGEVGLEGCAPKGSAYSPCWAIQSAVNDSIDRLYVTEESPHFLGVLDTKTMKEVATIPLYHPTHQGDGGALDGGVNSDSGQGVAVDPRGNVVYVADADAQGGISVVDGNTNRYVGTLNLGLPSLDFLGSYAPNEGMQPFQLAMNPVTGLLYAAAEQSGVLVVLETHPCGN